MWIDFALAGYLLALGVTFIVVVRNDSYWSKPQTWRLPGLVLAVLIAAVLPIPIGLAEHSHIDNGVGLYWVLLGFSMLPTMAIWPLLDSVITDSGIVHFIADLSMEYMFLIGNLFWVAVAFVIGKVVDRRRAKGAIEEQGLDELSETWKRRHRPR